MDIRITTPQKTDEEELKNLFTTVITQNFKDYGFYDTYPDALKREIERQFESLSTYFQTNGKEIYFLIAKDNDKIVGTIAYGKPSEDIKKSYHKDLTHIPEIKSAYVLPEYQGKGVGTRLLNEIIAVLRKNNIKEFCLDSGYPKAQQFWTKKLGQPIVTITNPWGAGNDYLIWHCKIQ